MVKLSACSKLDFIIAVIQYHGSREVSFHLSFRKDRRNLESFLLLVLLQKEIAQKPRRLKIECFIE